MQTARHDDIYTRAPATRVMPKPKLHFKTEYGIVVPHVTRKEMDAITDEMGVFGWVLAAVGFCDRFI